MTKGSGYDNSIKNTRRKVLDLSPFSSLLNDSLGKIEKKRTIKRSQIKPAIMNYVNNQRLFVKKTYKLLVADKKCKELITYGVKQVQEYYSFKRKQVLNAGDEALFGKLDIELDNYMSIVFNTIYRQMLESVIGKKQAFQWGRSLSLHKRHEHQELYGKQWLPGQNPPSKGGVWPGEDYGCKCALLIVDVSSSTIRKLKR